MISPPPQTRVVAGIEPFRHIVRDVLSLDRAVRWVAFEQAGQPPRWVSRDPESGKFLVGTGSCNDELLDPLILILAEGRHEIYEQRSSLRPVRFVLVAYDDLVQIAVRCGPDSHISIGVDPSADVYRLAAKLANSAACQAKSWDAPK